MQELSPGDVAYAVLWVFVIVEGLVVVALVQRLRRLVTPVWLGPPLGLALPKRSYPSVDGDLLSVGGDRDRPAILAFTSPNCAKCRAAAPFLFPFCRANAERFQVVFFSYGPAAGNREYARENALDQAGLPVALLEPELRERDFGVRGAPFVLLLDGRGVIVAKGRVEWEDELRQIARASGLGPILPGRAAAQAFPEPPLAAASTGTSRVRT